MVYDVTFRDSFDSAKNWVKDLRESANVPDLLIALVGNKSDRYEDATVTMEEAADFAREIKAEIVKESSAKDNVGV